MVAIRETPSYLTQEFSRSNPAAFVSMDLQQLFRRVMEVLEIRLSGFVWQGFFDSITPVSFVDDTLTIAAPSLFHKDWISDHYLQEIVEAASNVLCRMIRVVVLHSSDEPLPLPKKRATHASHPRHASMPTPIIPLRAPKKEEEAQPYVLESNPFNNNHTFETFVPGPSNEVAYAACSSVAEQPGSYYSPLFLFGPVGIGKTHLIHAIGLAAKTRNPAVRIVYMSAEQWVNAYIQAIRERRFDAFRNKFRNGCDILLIDDIQFLAGKDASQDEFFHTFNSLHLAHKQIVITSDKYPHEIQGLEERLRTRLSWGLVADIRPPEIETRVAILHKKAEACGVQLPNDVAHYLASQVTSSVRELEGALLRLSAFLSVNKTEISLEATKEYLSPVFKRCKAGVTPDQICQTVARYYDFNVSDIKGKSRQQPLTFARQVAMTMCRTHLSLSSPEIGRFFGGRDHSTVLASIRKIEKLLRSDTSLQKTISQLEKDLLASESARK